MSNIYQRINAVMKEIEYVKKDAKVQGYSAVTHDAVTAAVRQHMVDEGIVLTVTQDSGKFDDREEGAKMRLYHGTYFIGFTNIDDPTDSITVSVQSHAFDNGDKAPGKAMSYATKYALLKTFLIETGENEESRNFDYGNTPISAKQYETVAGLMSQAGKTEESLIKYLHSRGAAFNTVSEMTTGFYDFTVALLNSTIDKAND